MVLDTTQELDELYSIYKSLLDKELRSTDQLLAEEDLGTMKELAKEACGYSERASEIAKVIKKMEFNKTDFSKTTRLS
ncbi:MAG TPA: hypothetical protein VKM55_09625 [Candidatus Lokiarchaeia archaeon]|nr:hypothetical protein [Candidatus Lokiarchaeia archaeon]